ncbi:MAG: 30S ribosome-binding factor RbfA [Bacteroidetes bacterium]|nr:MAG: 30S ribosome-binding factor RbfA [Bacteroidota bacterium]
MSVRAEKVGSVIKRAIAEPVARLAAEHSAGFVSVTSVKLTSDLQIAKVYLNVFGGKLTPAQFLPIIDDKRGMLRKLIGSKVRLRFTPELRFYIDDTYEQMQHIQTLLDSVHQDSKETKVNLDDYKIELKDYNI